MDSGPSQPDEVMAKMYHTMTDAGRKFRNLKLNLLPSIEKAIRGEASLRIFQIEALKALKVRHEAVLEDPEIKEFESYHRHGVVSYHCMQWQLTACIIHRWPPQ